MDIERGVVEALFYDYSVERLIEVIEKKKDREWLLEPVPELMKWRMTHFDGKELTQAIDEFKRVCNRDYDGYDEKLWPLLYVSKIGGILLSMEHGRPVVRFEGLLRWRMLTLDVGEDLLSLSWLAMREQDQIVERTDFAWEDVLLMEETRRHQLIGNKSLSDIHSHIGHTSDVFGIRWVYWMNNCWDEPKMRDNRQMACVAACIRYYIYQIVTGGGCPSDQDMKDVIDARVGGEMLQTLHDIIYRKVDTASDNSMKPNIDGIEHWDYALRQDMAVGKEVLKSPYMMLAGERYLMYNFLKMLYSGSQDATKFAMMFYLYLLIKSRHRREFIQTNGLIGLSNYQQYEDADRNDQLNGLSEAKRRYGVQTALGKMRNNYLEARVGMRYKNASDDKKKKSSEANQGKEQEDKPLTEIRIEQPMFGAEKWKREPLLRQVRLVVTFSKIKYEWKHRLTYIARIKEEFDIIIKRTQRNKRLKKKDFSVVGIDFSSSDEYARPEVYAQLVRYARKKLFNHFTYHAGEDFYDLMDGLRTIEDILVFLKWDRHCRLGHVIALGVNAERYYKDRGRNVIVTRQTLLDNLVWFLGMQTRYRFPLTGSVRSILVEKIRELYGEIGYSVPFDLDKYQKSMKLRGDFPLKGIKGEGMATFVNCSLGEGRTLDSLRRNADVKTLFDEYIGSEDIHKKGEEIIHWKMPVGIEDGLRRIQEALLDVIGKKKIAIESCPTSNYMIGPFERYDELPLHKFQNRLTQNNISINTDDKGIIATSIEGEYALIAAAMAKGGIDEAVIRTKLDRVIEGAKKSRFSI